MKKRVYIEIIILIFSNVIFYSLSNPVQKIVRNDFYTYGFLTVKSIVTVVFIILIVTMGVICAAILIFKRYKEFGLLSIYNIVTTIFWLVLLSATMDYSLSWNRFHTAERIVILSFYILPLTFMAVTLIYRYKLKSNQINEQK